MGCCNMTKEKLRTKGDLWSKGSSISHPLSYCRLWRNFPGRHAMRPSKVPQYIDKAITQSPMMEESGFTQAGKGVGGGVARPLIINEQLCRG